MNPMNQLDSQPFFIEEENSQYLGESRKRREKYSDDEDQSQSLLAPKKRIINASNTYKINTQIVKEDAENSFKSDENKSGEDISAKPEEETTSNVKQCVLCIFDKDLDKRNYYFGNLLIGELQFLPPCMRSEAYINILKYIDALKHQHREKSNK